MARLYYNPYVVDASHIHMQYIAYNTVNLTSLDFLDVSMSFCHPWQL